VLAPGVWHDATWRFDPDGGTFAFTLDDADATPAMHPFPPSGWSPHLGAFTMFAGSTNDAYVTELKVSQP